VEGAARWRISQTESASSRRKPNREEFALKNFKAAMGEESPRADR